MGLVSIIILNWNNRSMITECIEFVLKQTYKNIQIIIIDNGSTDGSKELIKNRFPQLYLIEEDRNYGFAAAQNEGIKISQGSCIMPLNSDVILTSTFVEEMVKAIQTDEKIGTVSGKLLRIEKGEKTKIIDSTGHFLSMNINIHNRGSLEIDRGQYKKKEFVFGSCAAAPLYRKEMLESVKINNEYYDEDFFAFYEDGDLDWRAQLLGWKCIYTPDAIAYHVRGKSRIKPQRYLQIHHFKNRYLMMIKNISGEFLITNLFSILLFEIKNFFRLLSRPFLLEAVVRIIKLLPHTFQKREFIRQKKIVSDRYMKQWFIKSGLKKKIIRGKKYNILYIMSSTALSGTERELLQLLDASDNNIFHNMVVCPDDGPLVEEVRKRGEDVFLIKKRSNLSLRAMFKLYRLFKKKNIHLVHLMGNRIPAIIAKWCGIRVVQKRNQPTRRIRRIGRFFIINGFLDSFVDRIIAVSEAIRKDIIASEGITPAKIVTVYNGIEPDVFEVADLDKRKEKERLNIKIDKPVVGIIGRLHIQKGHSYFIKAAEEILKVVAGVQFLIVGDGLLKSELKKLAEGLNISGYIKFLGYQKDIPRILSILDISVLSSLWEGFPFVILESMAAAKPIVATDVGGIQEVIINGKTGIIVPPRDYRALARTIIFLLQNKGEAIEMGNAAKRRVGDYFKLERMARETEGIYLDLLKSYIKDNRKAL